MQIEYKSLKKLHLFVLKSFAGPFLVTFVIAMFVLVMQFLWLWIDELVGKGLGWGLITELLFYQSTTLIPLALPISILLSCIMTFGALGQHYEMVAMKAAGIPLRIIMAPVFVACLGLSVLAFYIANVVVPDSVLKSKILLYDVQQKKPSLNIKEGIFYNGIENFSIKVGKKQADGKHIEDVIIYDHSSNKGATGLVIAETGLMEMSADSSYLFFSLMNGTRYEELETKGPKNTLPFERTQFRKQEIVLDLTGFKMSRSSEELFKNNYQMLNINELDDEADSIKKEVVKHKKNLRGSLTAFFHIYDTFNIKRAPNMAVLSKINLLDNFTKEDRQKIIISALTTARTVKGISSYNIAEAESTNDFLRKIYMEWHRKFTLSFACLIFFFIGAPFGTIVRKGGLGVPMLAAVFIFVVYYMLMVMGEKFAKEGVLDPLIGTWMASFFMIPFGIFLTYKASIDSGLFNVEIYHKIFYQFIQLFKRKKIENSTAIQ